MESFHNYEQDVADDHAGCLPMGFREGNTVEREFALLYGHAAVSGWEE